MKIPKYPDGWYVEARRKLAKEMGWWALGLVVWSIIPALLCLVWWYRVLLPFSTYPGILIAMLAGFLGATFSMLIQCQQRASQGSLEELEATSRWSSLIVRGSVGLGAAVILYFFFGSGLLTGNLWPDLGGLDFTIFPKQVGTSTYNMHVPNKHWCLLVIWCFLAGFSETLVPTILQETMHKANTDPHNT